MSLVDTLLLMNGLAKQHNLDQPYVVGGLPRGIILAQYNPALRSEKIRDIDITTGSDDVHELAKVFANHTGGDLIEIAKNHYEVKYNGMLFDFSKNVKYPYIDDWLNQMGIDRPTNIQRETFSRDFTVNTLLLSLDFEKIIDMTERGRSDVANKILQCPLDCELSIRTDPKRILRAYWFKAKFGFEFSSELHMAIKTSLDYLESVNRRYASEMINKILRAKESLLEEMIADGTLKRLPMTKYVKDLLIKHKKILELL